MVNNLIITPEQFRDAADSVLKSLNKELSKNWWGRKRMTERWEKDEDGIYAQIADKLRMTYFIEYWSVDCIFYQEPQEPMEGLTKYYAPFIPIAMEHENDCKTSYEEINKLVAFVKAPLNVLVTYADSVSDTELLENYARQIKAADIYGEFSSDNAKQILVIFGIYNEEEETVRWDYWLYKTDSFAKLNP